MKLLSAISSRFSAMLILAALLLASCAKDEVVAPVGVTGTTKSLGTTLQSGENQEDSGSVSGRDTNGDGGWISDDGDDVGDGERNRKKKPNT